MAVRIEQPNLLVVEGREEELFFEALIKHLGLQNIQIMPIGGKEKLRNNLRALVSAPRFHTVFSLGIVRDANADPNAAFQSVCDALRIVNLPVPKQPLLPAIGPPRVLVLILPGKNKQGMLEDLCLEAVKDDPAMCCVEQYFQCLSKLGIQPRNLSKAKVQAFLASREEPGKRLGEAAQAGYWRWDCEAFREVKDFLQELVERRRC